MLNVLRRLLRFFGSLADWRHRPTAEQRRLAAESLAADAAKVCLPHRRQHYFPGYTPPVGTPCQCGKWRYDPN